MNQVNIRQDGDNVIILKDGKAILGMPWEAALAVSDAIRAKAKEVEELKKHDIIIADQALLFKAGFPLGLTNHPKMIREAAKQAGGIASGSVVGTPTIKRG